MSHYVKFTYQRARADIAPFDALAELNACRRKLLELRLMGVDSNWDRVRQLERPRRREQEFLHHRFSDGWSPRIDADGLRTSRGVRFRKELAPLRRRCDSFIGIVDARRDLRIRSIDLCSDSLSRLSFVADASRSRPTTSERRCLRHAGNGVRNHAPVQGKRCAKQKDFRYGGTRRRHCRLSGKILKRRSTLWCANEEDHLLAFENGFHERISSRHDGWTCCPEPRARRHAPQVCWNYSGEWRRASGGQIRCDSWS